LVIIWVAFLIPFGSRRASPAATVEEFERKMGILADANRQSAGRWVLVPRKGERFMGPRDRERVRVRRRRKRILVVLLESTAVTLLIGLFPPLRSMLVLTAVLAGVLVLYVLLLLQLRVQEVRRIRLHRARLARAEAQQAQLEARARFERVPVEALRRTMAYTGGNGNGHGNGNGNGRAYVTNGNGHGNGHAHVPEHLLPDADADDLEDVQVLLDDDVHVVVRRPDPEDRQALAR
jgi:hypothetical protein